MHICRIGSFVRSRGIEGEQLFAVARFDLVIECGRHILAHYLHTTIVETRTSVGEQFHGTVGNDFIHRNETAHRTVVAQQVEYPLAGIGILDIAEAVFQRPTRRQSELLGRIELDFNGVELQSTVGNDM